LNSGESYEEVIDHKIAVIYTHLSSCEGPYAALGATRADDDEQL